MSALDNVDPDEARRQAQQILGQQQFQQRKSLFERAWGWISDHLPDLPKGGGSSGGNPLFGLLGWILIIAVIGALIALLVWLVLRATGGWKRGGKVDAEGPTVERETDEPLRPARYWRNEAERLEAAGAWREALRARYRELIADLAEAGVIDEIPGRTAGEYRSDLVAERPDDGPAFAAATGLFEGAWYGGAASGPEESRQFRELADAVGRSPS